MDNTLAAAIGTTLANAIAPLTILAPAGSTKKHVRDLNTHETTIVLDRGWEPELFDGKHHVAVVAAIEP